MSRLLVALVALVISASVNAQTCVNVLYGSLSGVAFGMDYYETPFDPTHAPIIFWLYGNGWAGGPHRHCSVNVSGQAGSGVCDAFQWFLDHGFNIVAPDIIGTGGGGHTFPQEAQDTKAAIGYLTHFINTLNNSCTMKGDINDIRVWTFSSGGLEGLWMVVAPNTKWSSDGNQNCTYCDTGYTITRMVCMSCPGGDLSLIYQNGDSNTQTAISGLLGCAPSIGQTSCIATAQAASASLHITVTPVPVLVITGASDTTVYPTSQTATVTNLTNAGGTATQDTWTGQPHQLDFSTNYNWPPTGLSTPLNSIPNGECYTTGGGVTPCGWAGNTIPAALLFLTQGVNRVPVSTGLGTIR
jgi:hypothetical protein